ncbi:T6SS phospholipase effector Tle1-like catalytic domain-containing protein [Chitinimonas sp. PSY-7]
MRLWTSFFFDGTGNHRERDFPKSHSNIAALFDAHLFDEGKGIHRQYYEGLGTPFEFKDRYEKRRVRIDHGLYTEVEEFGYKEEGESAVGLGVAAGITQRLEKATFDLFLQIETWKKKRRLDAINLAAFGFSRGATEARAFMHWLAGSEKITKEGNKLRYEGIPLNIKFLGVFDTVESVGLPANNLMSGLIKTTLPPYVEKCTHIVAANELRHAFSLTVGDGKTRHIVYPGSHADVGGGYDLLAQGRPNTLARVALLQMLDEARGAGLRMLSVEEMKEVDDWDKVFSPSFDVPKQTSQTLTQYINAVKPSGSVQSHFETHSKQYWSWIDSGLAKTDADTKAKSPQFAANGEALRKMSLLLSMLARTQQGKGEQGALPNPNMVLPVTRELFANYVHDSFEHFTVPGSTQQLDLTGADYYKIRQILKPTA